MTRATFEGLARLKPDERPFVLTRATYAGAQRYAALWPGDNVSTWTALQGTIPLLQSLGLAGMPFVGSDIGGFADNATAELYTRWLQVGVFYPFMRTHTTFGTDDQEPWSYGVAHEILNRAAIELRYQLLPEIYNVMHQASETGIPAFRPLFLEFPLDGRTWDQDDQFMFGSDLLVAPVLRPEERQRGVYLPAGTWFDFWTGRAEAGGRDISVPVTLSSIPIYVRGGAFIFRQPVVQNTGEMRGQPLRVAVYPAASSTATLYEDDGESLKYKAGEFALRRFTQTRAADASGRDQQVTIEIGAAEGRYRPAARTLELSVRWNGTPSSVTTRAAGAQPQPLDGWTVDQNGFVVIKAPDRFDGLTVEIR
jgi:alpha-glucosidase